MGTPASIAELMSDLKREAGWENTSGARQHAEAIARIGGPEALEALASALESYDQIDLTGDAGDLADECWRACSALAHGLALLGAPAVPRLLAWVAGPARPSRSYAAGALGESGDPRGLLPLLQLASLQGEEHFSDRLAALGALGHHTGEDAFRTLCQALAPSSEQNGRHLRRIAANALGRQGDPRAAAVLSSHLSDAHWYVRMGVVEGLLQLRGAEAETALLRARQDPDARVAAEARGRGRA